MRTDDLKLLKEPQGVHIAVRKGIPQKADLRNMVCTEMLQKGFEIEKLNYLAQNKCNLIVLYFFQMKMKMRPAQCQNFA